ncbi:MAG: hypothetical protein ACRDEA_17955, partial [Microcystaceae cyanobacterium]
SKGLLESRKEIRRFPQGELVFLEWSSRREKVLRREEETLIVEERECLMCEKIDYENFVRL